MTSKHPRENLMGKKCPICNNDTNIVTEQLSYCVHCDHIFETDLKAKVLYDNNYLSTYIHHTTCGEMSAVRAGVALILPNMTCGKILDIGYANGSFLKAMERIGFDVYGIDVHGQDMGIREVSFDSLDVYELVTFFDSLEHFEDLALPQKLKAKNVIVSVPMRPDFFLTSPEKWKHYKPGEHLHYFSPTSLDVFMHKWGYEKFFCGHPEDVVRGRLVVGEKSYPNIYTSVYTIKKEF